MMIGRFTQSGDSFEGSIETLDLTVHGVRIEPVVVKQGNAPDYYVSADTRDSAFGDYDERRCEIGAAWQKTSKASGKPYLSVKLDGPTLAAPIHGALIRQADGAYGLIWRRREETASDEAA